MRDCIFLGFLSFILVCLLSSIINSPPNNNGSNVYPLNKTAIYKKEYLQDIVFAEETKIIESTIKSITYGVLYEAKRGRKNYIWKDDKNTITGNMYEKIYDEVIKKFPDVNIMEFDGYQINFDWS